nr:unnamed protein product [Callosobruchus analis]
MYSFLFLMLFQLLFPFFHSLNSGLVSPTE